MVNLPIVVSKSLPNALPNSLPNRDHALEIVTQFVIMCLKSLPKSCRGNELGNDFKDMVTIW